MNLFWLPSITQENAAWVPSTEQAQALLARFAVRGNAYKKGEASINGQFPDIKAEALQQVIPEIRAAATETTGNIATGSEYLKTADAVNNVSRAALETPTPIAERPGTDEAPQTDSVSGIVVDLADFARQRVASAYKEAA